VPILGPRTWKSSEAIASAGPTESAALATMCKSSQNPLQPSACEHERSDHCRALASRPRGLAPRFPIAQFPNPPLLLAFAGWVLAAESGGTAHEVGRAVFTLGLAVWAGEEAASGVNWFRRLLGAGALIWIVAGLASEFRGH
jgi:hypothetical protein